MTEIAGGPDVTELHRTVQQLERSEAQLRETVAALETSEARYRGLFGSELLGVGVWRGSMHHGGKIVETNDTLLRMLGYTRADFEAGLVTAERIAPPEMEHAKAFHELRTVGRCTPYEREYIAKDGTRVPVLLGSVLVCPDGVAPSDVPEDSLEISFYMLDMRELRAARERLSEGQRLEAIGRLAGGVAHDFNNMLVAMLGFVALAERSLRSMLSPSHPALRDLAEAQGAAERAAGLTRQLLAFSRRQVLQPSRNDLRGIVREFQRVLQQALGADKALILDLPDDELPIQVDRGQMEQVLLNLTLNARDATLPGGRLTLRGRSTCDAGGTERVVLYVEDTGHGMDAATRARIFEPFFTTKAMGKGTGLGLAMVYGVVKQSGGEIQVDSAPGAGTRFIITFPRDISLPEERRAEPAAPPSGGGRETILVVDDEQVVRDYARRVLEENGYHVVTAADGTAALTLIENANVRPDLVFADLMMPGLDGRALGERLTALGLDLPVIYSSGYTGEEMLQAGWLQASQWFLQKPWREEQLTRAVRQALDARVKGGAAIKPR